MTRNSQDADKAALDKVLSLGATNLMERAARGQLAHAYGRETEIAQVFEALQARRSVLLLGPANVGKTAVLDEVIGRIIHNQCPEWATGKVIVSISTGGVMVGTRYLGEWQTRLGELVEAVKSASNLYLYFEDIWALRDAGRASDKSDGFSTFLRPFLERHEIVLLGESTPENFNPDTYGARALADDQSLMKLFATVTIEEPSLDATRGILNAVARDLQRHYKVRIEPPAVERAMELTRRFLAYQAFPGKATHLLDETSSARAKEAAATISRVPGVDVLVTVDAVSATFSRITGLPERFISDTIPLNQSEIRGYFDERVVGQEEAVNAVSDVVTLFKAELNDPAKPLGVLFFVGPTGVGKTELAKTLAEYLFGSKDKLIRLDMSEYKSPASLPDVLQQLTEKQRRQSFSVLLLDEIEKASPYVFDLFLQAFDDARLTDSAGKTVYLNNTIVVMTSNIGTQNDERTSLGFLTTEAQDVERRKQIIQAVYDYFRPEFINRLDKIVVFRPLGQPEMRRIARRELGKALLREGVRRRDILLDFREDVLDVLVIAGFSPAHGARPLQRAVNERVLLPLARRIAEEPSLKEQLLELIVVDGNIVPASIPINPVALAEPPEETPEALRERLSITDDESGRTRKLDLKQLQGVVAAQQARILSNIEGERYQALTNNAKALLDETARPTFWDDPIAAKHMLSSVYQIERVTDRFVTLRNRAERLVEQLDQARRHHDKAILARLATTYEQLQRDLTLAELELFACNDGSVATEAVFIAISGYVAPRAAAPADWPATLRDMYVSWASRKGHEVEVISETDEAALILVRGPSLANVLAGEEGLHKLQRESDSPSEFQQRRPHVQLARVEILPSPGPSEPSGVTDGVKITVLGDRRTDQPQIVEASDPTSGVQVRVRALHGKETALALLEARRARHGALPVPQDQVARVYHLAKTQYVRDPRTGHRTGRPRDVLGGALDAFLLAYLGQQPTEAPRNVVAVVGTKGEILED